MTSVQENNKACIIVVIMVFICLAFCSCSDETVHNMSEETDDLYFEFTIDNTLSVDEAFHFYGIAIDENSGLVIEPLYISTAQVGNEEIKFQVRSNYSKNKLQPGETYTVEFFFSSGSHGKVISISGQQAKNGKTSIGRISKNNSIASEYALNGHLSYPAVENYETCRLTLVRTNSSSSVQLVVKCDKDGSYSMNNLIPGTYSYTWTYFGPGSYQKNLGSGSITISANQKEITKDFHFHYYLFRSEILKAATCTEDGETANICSCGLRETVIVPQKNHLLDDGIISKEATCTENGEKAQTCQNCGQLILTTIPATGHSWGNGAVSKNATCTEDGEKLYTCSKCSATKTEVIKNTGHSFSNEWDGDKDNHWHVCERCGEIADDSLKSHSFYNHRCTGCGTYEEQYMADYLSGTWNSSYVRGLLSDYWIFTNEWDDENKAYKGILCWKSGSQEEFHYNVFGTKITFVNWKDLPFTNLSMVSETKFTCLDANYPNAGTITHEKISDSVSPADLSF